MASITKDNGGKRRIQFVASDGKRKTIRLGKMSQRNAEQVKFRIERLLEAKLTGHAIDSDTARWVANLDPRMADKLTRAGLISKVVRVSSAKLGPFLREYLESRADLKPATKVVQGQVIRDLTDFFGETCELGSITPGDGDDFKQWLIRRELAATTIHKRIQVARSMFGAMIRRKLISENPFEGVKAPAAQTKDRQRFVKRTEIDQVLKACPDHHWRMIVVLARYGGLRTPSETLSLRWQDIDWESERIIVPSPKTEHAGKASRTIPLFAELRPYLIESFELAREKSEYVVDSKYRKAANGKAGWKNANLRTTFEKIVKRAGLEPWPRLFHNLRASRETELVEQFPVQVVTDWLGNSPNVAMRHYLMTTEEHFAAAVKGEPKAAQNAAQQVHAKARNTSQIVPTAHEKTPALPGFAGDCDLLQPTEVAGTGFEPATSRL